MGGLVEDLLLLAELDRGRPLLAEPVGLHRICADVVDDNNAFDHEHTLTMAPGPRGRRARRPRAPDPGRPQPRAQRAGPYATRNECPRHGAGRTRHGRAPGQRQRPGHGPGHRPPASSIASTARIPAVRDPAPDWAWPLSGPSPSRWVARRRWSRPVPAGAPPCWSVSPWRPLRRARRSRRPRRPYRRCAEPPGTRDSRTEENLTSVSAASASGSESATTPAPARRVRVRSSVCRSALRMPIIHSPSPCASTHPTGPAQ